MTQQQQQQQTNVLSLSPRKRVLFVDATWYHKGQQPHQGRLDFEKVHVFRVVCTLICRIFVNLIQIGCPILRTRT